MRASAGSLSGISVYASRELASQGGEPIDSGIALSTAVLRWGNGLSDQQWLEISRGLGGVKTERDEKEFRLKLAKAHQDWRDEYDRRWREGLAQQESLSPTAVAKLSAIHLTLPRFTSYPSWLLQEVIARRSGMHLISDCFYETQRPIQTQAVEDQEMWQGGKEARVSVLDVLRQACRYVPDRHHDWLAADGELVRAALAYTPGVFQGWEWGDAGSFLRFRSVRRDVWRGSLLPRDFVDRLDGALEPALMLLAAKRASDLQVIHLPFDLSAYRDFGRMMSQLSPLPWALGGSMIYGDPSGGPGRERQALQELALQVLRADNFNTDIYGFVSTLSDGQIARLQSDGLTWALDLKAGQQASLLPTLRYAKRAGLRDQDVPDLVLRVRPLAAITEDDAREPYNYLHLQFLSRGRIIFETTLLLDGMRLQDLPTVPELPLLR